MKYKPEARALIKKQQSSTIPLITTLQTKHFFRGETDLLSGFVLMKNHIRDRNPLIYHAEVPIALYGEDFPPTAVHKRKLY